MLRAITLGIFPHGVWHSYCLVARVQPKETDVDMATLISRCLVPGCVGMVWSNGEDWTNGLMDKVLWGQCC